MMDELLRLAESHVATFIPDLTPDQRAHIRPLFLAYFQSTRAGVGWEWTGCYYSSLDEALGIALYKLSDSPDFLNWNWQPICSTEQTMLYANRFLAKQANPGEKARWLAHPGACHLCQAMNSKVFTIVSPGQHDCDADTQAWVGKWADITRSGFGPYRRPIKHLKPVIPLHRGCQCMWVYHVDARVRS